MSEIRANKIAALGADIQFWTGAPTEKLRIDGSGNLCFGAVGAAGAHIPPPDGIAPMYSARAWGRIITSTNSQGQPVIDYTLSKTKNINRDTSLTKWLNQGLLQVTFARAMPSTSYIVVANCDLNATNPLLVSKVNADSTASIMKLNVYNAAAQGGIAGSSPPSFAQFLNFGLNTVAYPQLLDFAVFA